MQYVSIINKKKTIPEIRLSQNFIDWVITWKESWTC